MPARNEFVEHVLELLTPLGPVRPRAMFGGWGLYLDDIMFALIAWDTLYLKADERNRPAFEAKGMGPFVHEANGRRTVMSYWQPPPDALEDGARLRPWAEAAHAAAVRARKPKPKRAPTGTQ